MNHERLAVTAPQSHPHNHMKRKKRKPSKVTKQASRRRPKSTGIEDQRAAESRTAVAATVAWMLALMATVFAEVLGLTCQLYTRMAENLAVVRVLATVMLFVACLAGLITLVMTPIVLHVAEKRPPRMIVLVAVLAGSLPLLVIILQQFVGSGLG